MLKTTLASALAITATAALANHHDTTSKATEPDAITLAEARASTVGTWRGELQYRDYQADQWFGIPVTVEVELAADGVTLIRRAAFDDGPGRGLVYITNVNMLGPDGSTEYTGMYRADRAAEHGSYMLKLASAQDAQNWVIVAMTEGSDDNRPAMIRETTTRSGDSLTTLKQVDFTDDDVEEWLDRNRTVLTRLPD